MELNKTNIALRKNLFINPNIKESEKFEMATTVQAHLMQLGHMLSQSAFEVFKHLPEEQIIDFHVKAYEFLQESLGNKHSYTPLYPGFPEEVIKMGKAKKFIQTLAHSWSRGMYNPSYNKKWDKPITFEHSNFTVIELGTEEGFDKIFTNLVSINQSLAPQDMKIIEWFSENRENLVFPKEIPFKENLCVLAAKGLDVPVNTPTDVLRIATYLSTGDSSLAPIPNRASLKENAFFKKFSRKKRRFILSLLEKTGANPKEMISKQGRWVRLGEILHPGDYADKYPRAYKAFKAVRNNEVRSWHGDVDAKFEESFEEGVKKLSQRAGEFARKLDALIRKNPDKTDFILDTFKGSADSLSNKVIFELMEHFDTRRVAQTRRTVFPKGARRPVALPLLKSLDNDLVNEIQEHLWLTVKEKFKKLDSLGKVWIDPELSKVPVPKNMRSISDGLKPVIRGQRFNIDTSNHSIVRAYVHWFNDGSSPRGNDIDLSGIVFSEDGSDYEHVGWNSKYNLKDLIVYSGDVMDRKGACAEYLDFDIKGLHREGYKYGIIDIRDYRSNPKGIADYKDCVFGVMLRKSATENKTWSPKTVTSAHNINTPSTGVVVAGIDFEDEQYFIIDMDVKGNVSSKNVRSVFELMKLSAEPPKFSVKDLLQMHVDARGEEVLDETEADNVFLYDDFIHSYERTAQLLGV